MYLFELVRGSALKIDSSGFWNEQSEADKTLASCYRLDRQTCLFLTLAALL